MCRQVLPDDLAAGVPGPYSLRIPTRKVAACHVTCSPQRESTSAPLNLTESVKSLNPVQAIGRHGLFRAIGVTMQGPVAFRENSTVVPCGYGDDGLAGGDGVSRASTITRTVVVAVVWFSVVTWIKDSKC